MEIILLLIPLYAVELIIKARQKALPEGVTSVGVTAQELKPKPGVTDAERDKAIEFMAKTAGRAERINKPKHSPNALEDE